MASYDIGVSGGIDIESVEGETPIFVPHWDVVVIDNFGTVVLAGDVGVSSQSFDVNSSWVAGAEQGEGGSGNIIRSVPYLVRTIGQ